MNNYVFLYYTTRDMADKPDESAKKAYMDWFEGLGDKLVDAGNPFNTNSKAISKDGVMDVKDMPAGGYSIVKAGSMDQAIDIAKSCPIMEAPGGTVCVYETMPM